MPPFTKVGMEGFSDKEQIEAQIQYMEDIDMAVVVSQEQNEIDKFKKLGLDIAKHRKRMVKEERTWQPNSKTRMTRSG